MPIYKRCDSCGKRLPSGTKCTCRESTRQKLYDKTSRNRRSETFYHSDDWCVRRQQAKERFHGIDIVEYYKNQKIVYGHSVHHIVPIKDDWSKRLDLDNLIYLSESNHQKVHELLLSDKRDKVIKELNELVARWCDEMSIGGTLESF